MIQIQDFKHTNVFWNAEVKAESNPLLNIKAGYRIRFVDKNSVSAIIIYCPASITKEQCILLERHYYNEKDAVK